LNFCGLALIFRLFSSGSIVEFDGLCCGLPLRTILQKFAVWDIPCGCFGHASQKWKFSGHLRCDLGILAACVLCLLQRRASACNSRPILRQAIAIDQLIRKLKLANISVAHKEPSENGKSPELGTF